MQVSSKVYETCKEGVVTIEGVAAFVIISVHDANEETAADLYGQRRDKILSPGMFV